MAIIVNDNFEQFAPKPLDDRYGPWTSTTQANDSILIANRHIGLTVGILTGDTSYSGGRYVTASGGTVEYWYYTGITDLDLVIKINEGFDGTSGSSGSSGTSGSSGSSGTSGSSGSSGTSGSSGSSGTSGEGLCNKYKVDANLPNANGEIQFVNGLTSATQINIFDTNADNVDWTEYYEMIVGRKLSGTLTVTEFNDTDSYIIYEFDAAGTSFGSNILTITPTAIYASPLVDTTNAPVDNV